GGAVDASGRPLYRVRTCTVDGGPVRTSAHYTVLPDHDTSILRTAATIVIPGIVGGPPVVEGKLDPTVAAALSDRRPGSRLVSICTGAYVLAAAGLLDGRPATTHWMRTEPFRSFFPTVQLDPDVLYVDDGDVLTSAGNAAGIDLLLHVVRRDHGAEVANRVARRNVVAPWRDGGQSQFSTAPAAAAEQVPPGPVPDPARAPGHRNGEAATAFREPGIPAARTFALERLGEPLPLTRLAGSAAMSVRTFTRRFREETGQSPHTWLAAQRVALARRLLETTELPVERIAVDAGFGTAASLRRHLRAAIGVSPGSYRRMYRGPQDRGVGG
ncbi:MAG TPA: helix-turn-helix domain-containing protein, partial [Pseudonocardia sp.]|nr:helix-turn-helix domain-containing protein [Pseudonocardia sp.]